MSAISPHSPGHDLEHGTSRRKRLARLPSDIASPASSRRRGPPRPLSSPWPKFSSRRARLVWVFVCVCLAAVSRSAWLPLLVRRFSSSPAEPSLAQADRGSPVPINLDPHSVLVRQASISSRLQPYARNSTRRFLTFLPHSGFNNQRIALENAMLLSYMLNCTLIAPPVRLGEPLPYRPFDTLMKWNEHASQPRSKPCAQYPLFECMDAHSYAQMSWNTLVDFAAIRKELGLDIIFMHGSQTPLQSLYHMGIPEPSIAFLKDKLMYQYIIRDSTASVGTGSKYSAEWHLDHLRKMLESSSAIHFGTLFGTGRLRIRNPAYTAAHTKIHNSIVISHQGVLNTAKGIRRRIAALSPDNSTYVAVHVRLTGRKFKPSAKANGRLIWWKLITWLGISPKNGVELERKYLRALGRHPRSPASPTPGSFTSSTRLSSTDPHTTPSGKLACDMRRAGPELAHLEIPLFIATDAPNPRTHPALGLFLATFDRVCVLDDFRTELGLLDAFRGSDGLSIGQFLVPLVDMVVAGQATNVFGTPNSTFSNYITRTLHPSYSRST